MKTTRIRFLGILVGIPLLFSACASRAVIPSKGDAPLKTVAHEVVLGKSLTDGVVAGFVTKNGCSNAGQFLLCQTVGMASWTDSNQIVETVYLYLNNADGFEPYRGELPFGLRFYDTLGAVEYKLKRQGVGNAGRSDAGVVPDHMHYRAIYKDAGMTILYNSPFADEDATIYAVLISN